MEFNYKSFTLAEIEEFEFYEFICDGDSKKIIVNENEKYEEEKEKLKEGKNE